MVKEAGNGTYLAIDHHCTLDQWDAQSYSATRLQDGYYLCTLDSDILQIGTHLWHTQVIQPCSRC